MLPRELSPIINYPSFNALLMQAFEDSNKGNQAERRRKMLWVEEGRGE